MPYIKETERNNIKSGFADAVTPGELNFLITSIVDKYLTDNGLNYNAINNAVGALECAKLELYRRIAVPYEDKKIRENGDVYVTKVI